MINIHSPQEHQRDSRNPDTHEKKSTCLSKIAIKLLKDKRLFLAVSHPQICNTPHSLIVIVLEFAPHNGGAYLHFE